MATVFDLQSFAMTIDTARQVAINQAASPMENSPGPSAPPKRRLGIKQARPPAFFVTPSLSTAGVEGASDRSLDKYWHARSQAIGQGNFECPIAGCGRLFKNKSGLSHHMLLSHREGTYRDRTWDCPHCPRTFELELGLTKHLPLHIAGARPSVCCECGAYFPGKPSARMHVNHAHPASAVEYPLRCPHCPAEAAPLMTSAHMYSMHRLKRHVY